MRKHKSSVSEATSYKEVGEFWDTHDLTEFWDKTRAGFFEVDIESEITYYAVDKMLSEKIQAIAQKRGVTADTLVNLWVQEKLQEQKAS
ncbi:MAG TPA: CopG family antitoxin [Candidatus Wunengus sp. YC61]|uniref:CopG family antitoxin n=1 Tax=Candidatus Wunengus sp. YC61 TaxID=3367698 RepID=UPI0040259772